GAAVQERFVGLVKVEPGKEISVRPHDLVYLIQTMGRLGPLSKDRYPAALKAVTALLENRDRLEDLEILAPVIECFSRLAAEPSGQVTEAYRGKLDLLRKVIIDPNLPLEVR